MHKIVIIISNYDYFDSIEFKKSFNYAYLPYYLIIKLLVQIEKFIHSP